MDNLQQVIPNFPWAGVCHQIQATCTLLLASEYNCCSTWPFQVWKCNSIQIHVYIIAYQLLVTLVN